jgi:hypothetical protein
VLPFSKHGEEGAAVIVDEAEALLDPVAGIDGFLLGCLVDAATGMVVAARSEHGDLSLPAAAAGAVDIAHVLSLLTAELPTDGLEDVLVTFRDQLYVTRPISPDAEPQILLVVLLDRLRANLALARREIRAFCASYAG